MEALAICNGVPEGACNELKVQVLFEIAKRCRRDPRLEKSKEFQDLERMADARMSRFVERVRDGKLS